MPAKGTSTKGRLQNNRLRQLRTILGWYLDGNPQTCLFCHKKITKKDIAKDILITTHHITYDGADGSTKFVHRTCHKRHHVHDSKFYNTEDFRKNKCKK